MQRSDKFYLQLNLIKCVFANINLLAVSVLLYFPQDILYRGSWSATVLSSHLHIQITNYSMSISHCQKCTVGADGIYIPPLPPSISLSLSLATILSSSVSPFLMPIMALFLSALPPVRPRADPVDFDINSVGLI